MIYWKPADADYRVIGLARFVAGVGVLRPVDEDFALVDHLGPRDRRVDVNLAGLLGVGGHGRGPRERGGEHYGGQRRKGLGEHLMSLV